VYAVAEKGVVCVCDHVNAWLNGDELIIENPTIYPARIKVMAESTDELAKPLGLYWQEKMTFVNVAPNGRAALTL